MKGVGEQLKIVGQALNSPIKSMGLLYDYFVAQKVQRSLHGDKLTKAHPELKREAVLFEKRVAEFRDAVETALRKHRKRIWEKQFVQKRIAEMAMDLYRTVAVISRTTWEIETKGPRKSEAERSMARAFCGEANRRIRRKLRAMERNVDEDLEAVARAATDRAGYPSSLFP
jgi:acyl-CoA dehydrogenase family protein 9